MTEIRTNIVMFVKAFVVVALTVLLPNISSFIAQAGPGQLPACNGMTQTQSMVPCGTTIPCSPLVTPCSGDTVVTNNFTWTCIAGSPNEYCVNTMLQCTYEYLCVTDLNGNCVAGDLVFDSNGEAIMTMSSQGEIYSCLMP